MWVAPVTETMNSDRIGRKRAQERKKRELSGDDRTEQKIDRDLADSFPASDPPGWTSGVERRKRRSSKEPQR
jgi:hypothetical protein